jgi:hypothetical protein
MRCLLVPAHSAHLKQPANASNRQRTARERHAGRPPAESGAGKEHYTALRPSACRRRACWACRKRRYASTACACPRTARSRPVRLHVSTLHTCTPAHLSPMIHGHRRRPHSKRPRSGMQSSHRRSALPRAAAHAAQPQTRGLARALSGPAGARPAARRARAPARRGTRAAGGPEGAGACGGPARGARACTARHAGNGRARGCRGLWGGPARGARLHDEVHGQQEGEDAQQHHRPQAGLAVAGHEQHDVQQPQRRQEEQQRGDVDARLRRAAPPPLSARVPPGGAGLYGGPRRWASQPARTLSNMDEWTAWMTKTDKALWEWVHDRRWMTAWPGAHARHAAAGHADDGLPAVHLH